VRFDVSIRNAETETRVVEGYTLHAVTDGAGKPIRPPSWLVEAMQG
jgi:acyl-CoA thioesterase FadM